MCVPKTDATAKFNLDSIVDDSCHCDKIADVAIDADEIVVVVVVVVVVGICRRFDVDSSCVVE